MRGTRAAISVAGMLALGFALAAAISAATPSSLHPDTFAIVPRRMSVDMVIDPAAAQWTGSTRGWLTVRRPLRVLVLRFGGPELSRVEMNQLPGAVPLQFSTPVHDSLVVVADRGLVPGPAGLNVACIGAWSSGGRGWVRRSPGTVALVRGGTCVIPEWPEGAPLPTWSLDVHVPAGCTVRANLPRTEITRQLGWRTWSFASKRPMPADSVWVEVRRPAAPRRAARR